MKKVKSISLIARSTTTGKPCVKVTFTEKGYDINWLTTPKDPYCDFLKREIRNKGLDTCYPSEKLVNSIREYIHNNYVNPQQQNPVLEFGILQWLCSSPN